MSQDREVTTLLRTSTFESELNDAVGITNVHPWKRSNPLILKEKLENCSDYIGFLPLFQGLTIPHSSSKSRRNWRFIDTFSSAKQKKVVTTYSALKMANNA